MHWTVWLALAMFAGVISACVTDQSLAIGDGAEAQTAITGWSGQVKDRNLPTYTLSSQQGRLVPHGSIPIGNIITVYGSSQPSGAFVRIEPLSHLGHLLAQSLFIRPAEIASWSNTRSTPGTWQELPLLSCPTHAFAEDGRAVYNARTQVDEMLWAVAVDDNYLQTTTASGAPAILSRHCTKRYPPDLEFSEEFIKGHPNAAIDPSYVLGAQRAATAAKQLLWNSSSNIDGPAFLRALKHMHFNLVGNTTQVYQALVGLPPGIFSIVTQFLNAHGIPAAVSSSDLLTQDVIRKERELPSLGSTYHGSYVSMRNSRSTYILFDSTNSAMDALALLFEQMRALSPGNSDAAIPLIAKFAYLASMAHPFERNNWGVFYILIHQMHQRFGLGLRPSNALDVLFHGVVTVDAAEILYRTWLAGELDAALLANPQYQNTLLRYWNNEL